MSSERLDALLSAKQPVDSAPAHARMLLFRPAQNPDY